VWRASSLLLMRPTHILKKKCRERAPPPKKKNTKKITRVVTQALMTNVLLKHL